jgi:hypothetical protein
MSRWYSEIEEYSKISLQEKLLRDKIVAVIEKYTKEMEGYSYFGSNPGVPEDDYEEIADDLLLAFNITEK